MNIKNRIFALIAVDMILPTNFIYNEIFNHSPYKYYDWIGEALLNDVTDIYGSYWWMWAFIIIAYLIFTYKSEGGELSKMLDKFSDDKEDKSERISVKQLITESWMEENKSPKPSNDEDNDKSDGSIYGFSGMEILGMIFFLVCVFSFIFFFLGS